MNIDLLDQEIKEYCKTTHGSTDHNKEIIYVKGDSGNEYAPFLYLKKKVEGLSEPAQLVRDGYIYTSLDFFGDNNFLTWYEKQFGRKLTVRAMKPIEILERPNNKVILDSLTKISEAYENFKKFQIITNGKNLPVQLGEWFARCVFGLKQEKSTSQRGFDFYLDGKRVEVKVHWSDLSSPKGVKIRKSLIELSEYCVIIYLSTNFMIRELCFLDSEFVTRKFSSKGHTLFLKDSDLLPYFFSRSSKHADKIANQNALMKYSSPQFTMKILEYFKS